MKRTASVKRYDNFSKEGTEFLFGFLDSSQNWQYVDGGNLHVDIFGESDGLGEDQITSPSQLMPDDCKFYLVIAPVSKISKYFDADDWMVAGRYVFSLTARPETLYYSKYLAGEKRREHATKLFSSYAVGDTVRWRGTENCNMQKIGCMIGTAQSELLFEEPENGVDAT